MSDTNQHSRQDEILDLARRIQDDPSFHWSGNEGGLLADSLLGIAEQAERYEWALERIRDWRGFRHTGEVRDCAGKALRGR